MSFPRYPKYKDSGVEWLGEVPEHWSVEPFKRQIERNDGGVWGDDPDGLNDTIVLRSTEQTVDGRWQLDDPAPRKLSEADIDGSLLVEGDLLLTKSSGSSLHIGKTTLVTPEIAAMRCCYSNFMQRIRTRPSFSPKLAWHVLNNDLARRQFDLLSNSTTGLANLNGTMIGQIVVPVPPLLEQTQIAAFLDRETAKIDELVAEQRRLMELLKEKRQAVISHAVTQGLNPNAPMKPSGIEWLGDVPAHWGISPLKYVATYNNEVLDEITAADTEIVYVDISSVDGVYGIKTKETILFSDAPSRARRRVRHGDVIVSTVRTYLKAIARIRAPEENLIVSTGFAVIRPRDELTPDFLGHLLFASYFIEQVIARSTGVSYPAINASELVAIPVTVPPPDEQAKIAVFLDTELAKLDTLTAEAQRAIDLLQERRTALISAAVTGQIDVRPH